MFGKVSAQHNRDESLQVHDVPIFQQIRGLAVLQEDNARSQHAGHANQSLQQAKKIKQ